MGRALGTLRPPMLPMLLSSAGMRLVPRGTWRLQLARPPSRSTQGCSWQRSPLCQRVVLCLSPQPATLPGRGEGGISLPRGTRGNRSTA